MVSGWGNLEIRNELVTFCDQLGLRILSKQNTNMKQKKFNNQIVIYQAKSGALELRADAARFTFWLTQQQVAQIFNVQKAAVSKHVKNIFESGELEKRSTVSKMETVRGGKQSKGQRKNDPACVDASCEGDGVVRDREYYKSSVYTSSIIK